MEKDVDAMKSPIDGFFSRHGRNGEWHWIHLDDSIPWRVIVLSDDGWGTLGYGKRTGQTSEWASVGYAAEELILMAEDNWRDCDPTWFEMQWSYLRPQDFQDPRGVAMEYFRRCRVVLRELSRKFTMEGQRPISGPCDIRRGEMGIIADLGTMVFHGYGITVHEYSGAEIGFDWNVNGSPCGNRWNLQQFSESCGSFFTRYDFDKCINELTRRGDLLSNDGESFLIPLCEDKSNSL